MHKTYARLGLRYSLFSSALAISIFSTASFLSAITGIKVVKTDISFLILCFCYEDTFFLVAVTSIKDDGTNTSFLTFYSYFEDTCQTNDLSFYNKNIQYGRSVFLLFGNNIDTYNPIFICHNPINLFGDSCSFYQFDTDG